MPDPASEHPSVSPEDLEHIRRALAGRYRVGEEIGHGGMATVFAAEDANGVGVAVKVMRSDLGRALGTRRFLQEVRIASELRHHGILGLIDSGDLELTSGVRVPYYVMPLVLGPTLRERLDQHRQLPVEEAVRIAAGVAEALAHAHRRGIVHRDIKPQNILLQDGKPLVADFGVARAVTLAGGNSLTTSGLVVGTPGYMSPEQASPGSPIDGRSDIYAVGCILYEMLVGSPPFVGGTQQAVLARHMVDRPMSIQSVRPAVSPALEAVTLRCLEKVPADRFQSAEDLLLALGAAGRHPSRIPGRGARRAAAGALAVAAVLVVAALIRTALTPAGAVDPRQVVVFPFRVVDTTAIPFEAGEAVATYIGHGLEQTDPLKWLDGWALLSAAQRGAPASVSGREVSELTRRHRARYYITGQILQQTDSLTVVVSLFDALGDTLVRRAGRSALVGQASLPQLGLRAVGALLPALLAPGRRIDLGALEERRPSAVAHFLQGEAEYRRMRFEEALPHYRLALADDSVLAIAALRAAEAANWEAKFGEDEKFVASALSRSALLPPRDRPYALGLQYYFAGRAEEARGQLSLAAASDSGWAEAWTALGEVFYHLFPHAPPLDSLAEEAFTVAVRSDSGFTPALFHLAQLALRRNDTAGARRMVGSIKARNPGSVHAADFEILFRCIAEGPARVDWPGLIARAPGEALSVAQWASSIAYDAACGEAGFRAVLRSSASPFEKWGAVLALQGLLVALNRGAELPALFEEVRPLGLPAPLLYLLGATVDTMLRSLAQPLADERDANYAGSGPPTLWLLGEYAASRNDGGRLLAILAALRRQRDSSRTRRDSLIVRILEAREPLLRGDTAATLDRLTRLTPSGPRQDLEWQPWESLGPEFLTLAELLLRRGEPREAWNVASRLDAPYPVVFPMFMPKSVAIRIEAARALGSRGRAEMLERRLARFRGKS